MARLPLPGADNGDWGDILNDYLKVTHNDDGTLKGSIVSEANLASAVTAKLNAVSSGIADGSVTNVKVASDAAIDQSKIAGLTAALNAKASTADLNAKADASALAAKADVSALNAKADVTALAAKADISSLKTVATSGSYADLTNKPTIPTVTGTNTGDQTLSVSGANLTISGGNTVVLPTGGTGSASWGAISGTVSDQADLQTALNAKISTSSKGTANGVASLNGSSLVPTAQLGSGTASATTYLSGNGTWSTPATGGGSITASQITDASTVGRGVLTATSAQTARDALTLGNVNNTSDASKPVSTATQAALDLKANLTDTRFTDQRVPTDGSVTRAKMNITNTPTANQILSWNGTAFTWVNPPSAGGGGYTAIAISDDYTAVAGNFVIGTTTAGSIQVTLPAPANGIKVTVKKLDNSVNAILVLPPSGQISAGPNTSASISVNNFGQVADFMADGTTWHQVG